MSGELDNFKQLLDQKGKSHVKVQTAFVVVKDVNWEEKTMTAEGVTDSLDFHNVLLGIGSVYMKPKKDGKAIIGMVENKDNFTYLIWAEKVEEVALKVEENAFMQVTNEGFKIDNQGENLKQVLNDILDEIKKLCEELNKVKVNVGVTPNVIAITAIKNKIDNQLRNRLNKILN